MLASFWQFGKISYIFKEGIPKEAIPFWSGVAEYTNLLREQPFEALANYALSCLTTPISNAVMERIFSLNREKLSLKQ